MSTYIAVPRVFEMFHLTEGKWDGSDPFNPERGSIGRYKNA